MPQMEENIISTDTHSLLEDGGLTSLQAGCSSALSRSRDTNSSASNRKRERGEGERMGGLGEGSHSKCTTVQVHVWCLLLCGDLLWSSTLLSTALSWLQNLWQKKKRKNIGKIIAVRPANTLTSRQQVRASAAASEVWVCLTEMREEGEEEGEGGEKLHIWRETELMNRLSLRRSVATEANC